MRLLSLLFGTLLIGCPGKDDTGGEDSTPTDDADGDGFTLAQGDCDDTDDTVNPDEAEVWYDGVDQNCDGNDQDQDQDGYEVAVDCVDTDAAIHPEAAEVACDAVDQDCDGSDLVENGVIGYADMDGDGYGSAASPVEFCADAPPDDVVADGTDCDDARKDVYPGAVEVCNDRDDDCDSVVDEGAADGATWYYDADADGYGDPTRTAEACEAPEGYVSVNTDCFDGDPRINPGADEECDQFDNDCDGSIDEDIPALYWYADADGDGFGDLDDVVYTCGAPSDRVTDSTDCNDADGGVYPTAIERCDDVDQDCDGEVDEGAADAPTWYEDRDGDSWGGTTTLDSCVQPDGFVADAGDCDENAPAINPDAVEACDGDDNDCDGSVDELGATGETTWYADADADGYGDAAHPMDACDLPDGYADNADDCDDTEAVSNPVATELDDLLDNDCDGWVDEDYLGAGSLVITEIARQPAFGGASAVTDGQWFEVYNPDSARTVVLDNFYVVRFTVASDFDAWFVDPADGVVLPPLEYAVFCHTDLYEASAGAAIPLLCDYVWGDPAESSSYEGYYRDNTFHLQRDEDNLALYVGGGTRTGTLIDSVTWTYDATDGYWPRDRSYATGLDPDSADATLNDDEAYWCSTPTANSYLWWTDGTANEYGTPGVENPSCD